MSVRSRLVTQFWKIHPDQLVSVSLKFGTNFVCLSGINAPMGVSNRCETIFNEQIAEIGTFVDNQHQIPVLRGLGLRPLGLFEQGRYDFVLTYFL